MEAKVYESAVKTQTKVFTKKKKKAYNEGFTGITNIIANIILALAAIACIFPFIFVIIISLTSEQSLLQNGYSIFPKEWSLDAYKYLIQ